MADLVMAYPATFGWFFLGIGTGYQGFMDLKWLGGMNGHIKKLQVSSQLLLGVAIIP